MKPWLIPVYAVIGFIAILWVMPQSRWVIHTQVDVVAARWRYLHGPGSDLRGGFEPVQRGLDNGELSSDPNAVLLQLLNPTGNAWHEKLLDQRVAELYPLLKARGDKRYWSAFVRIASNFAMIPRPHEVVGNEQSVQMRLKGACLKGEALDPDNAYFPAILSGVLYRTGDLAGARSAFLRAASKPRYDDYIWFEPQSRIVYLEGRFGYIGNQFRAHIYFDTFLEQANVINSLKNAFTSKTDFGARAASLRLAATIMSQASNAIVILVSSQLAMTALDPDDNPTKRSEVTATEIDRMGNQLARELGKDAGISNSVRVLKSIRRATSPYIAVPDHYYDVENLWPAFSAWSLLSLILLPVAMAMALGKAKSQRFADASPYLVWLMALSTVHAFGVEDSTATAFGAASLLFIPALFPRAIRHVDLLAIIVLVIAAWISVGAPLLLTPSILFLGALLFQRRLKDVSTAHTTVALIATSMIGAGYWVSIAIRHTWLDAVVFGLAASIGVFSGIPVSASFKKVPALGWACLVLGLIFAGMVVRDIVADRQLGIICTDLLNAGDRLRAK